MSDHLDDDLIRALGDRVGQSNLTHLHLYLMGRAVFDHIGVTAQLGHSSPGDSLDYLRQPIDEDAYFDANAMLRDFIVWTSGRKRINPDAEASVRAFFAASGWGVEQAARINEALA